MGRGGKGVARQEKQSMSAGSGAKGVAAQEEKGISMKGGARRARQQLVLSGE